MKRPLGVTLSAIALGLLAAFTLLIAALMTFGAFAMRHLAQPLPVTPGAPPPPSPAFLLGILLVFSLVAAGVGAWEILTTIGLLRLRSWARYSVMVIGGLLAFLGLVSALGIMAAAVFLPAMVAQGNATSAPPHLMRAFLVVYGLFYLGIAAVGIWWLVYFNLRGTKRYFTTAYAIDPVFYPGDAGDPQLYRATGRFARTPTSVMVIAWLYLLSGVLCLGLCWLPFPAYLFGFILTGVGPHVLYVVFGVIAGWIGWRLMNLDNRARLAVYGFTAYGLVNFATMLTPWGRGRYVAYNELLHQRMQIATPQPELFNPASFGFLAFMFGFCVVFYGVQMWLLERHKRAFTMVPPPLG